ncbi:ABC transporter permease [Chelatococcus sp. GCM10030263]|uniref:ABC transporter permease n=1 Tax=Chelatococcus sp. GCM10030263 TaxID=3273387 RepID=UPI003610895B
MAAQDENGAAVAPGDTTAYWPTPLAARLYASVAGVLVYLRAMAVFLVVWHLASLWIGNPILLPSPLDAARALVDLTLQGEVFSNVAASLTRLGASFALAVLLGVPLGFAMGLSRAVFEMVDPLIELLRPISGIAWIPLGMFILGVGEALPTAIMFYGAFFPIVINTVVGVRSVNPSLVQAARVLGVGHAQIVRHVVWPAALPNILVGARLGAGAGWMAMVAAELIGAPSGLGFAVEWYRELLMTPSVLAFVFLIGLLGYLFDRLLRWLQRVLTPWSQAEGGVS